MNTTETFGQRSSNRLDFEKQFWSRIKLVFCLAAMLDAGMAGAPAQTNARVVAWGEYHHGQTNVPASLSNVIAVAVSAAWDHSLVLKADGKVVAWGYMHGGHTTVPSGLIGVSAIASGGKHCLALKSNGVVTAWGRNDYGQRAVPPGLNQVAAIAAGDYHSLALESGRTVVAWGRNDSGQTNVPAGLNNVIGIAAGTDHSLALKSDGTVVGWGSNGYGQRDAPAGLQNVIAIAAQRYHSLALLSNGTVVVWGSNNFGQTNVPLSLTNAIAIAAGGLNCLALTSEHKVVAWGLNNYGQTDVPPTLAGVSAIAAGDHHSLAVIGCPRLESPPVSQLVVLGASAEFQVQVSGIEPLHYQWFFNETTLISDATNAILQLPDTQFAHSGSYRVVVTNGSGSVTSSPATLTVTEMPVIVRPPTNQWAWVGGAADFSASATGIEPLAYQWCYGGGAIPGATNSTLQLTNIQFSQAGAYTVVVTNTSGAATSAPAVLAVYPPTTVPAASEAILRAAMAYGGKVTFDCDGVIVLASTITNEIDTVLDGTGRQVIINGNGACRSFFVKSNVSFTVLNLTIANGRSDQGAGIYNAGGCVTLRNCRFAGNNATGSAAAYYSGDPGSDGCGGAVYNSGSLNAINCTFLSNSVVGGAGAQSTSPSVPGGAGGDGNGGAIGNSGILIMTGCLLVNNSASGGVGGVGYAASYSFFPDPGGPGGAGGDGQGGALFNDGSAFLVNNTFALNAGVGGQGGSGGSGSPPMSESSWSGDGGHGGTGGSGCSAIYDGSGKCHLTNCTVTSNPTIRGTGGPGGPPGGWPYPYPPRQGQPGANGSNGTPGSGLKATGTHLVNTLLSSNTPGNCIGTITDAGHNLSSDGSCAFTNVESLNNTEPKLGPLADNGGPTLTMALLTGSPAIDAGDTTTAPTTDQRGVTRPFGAASDIGAYEYAPMLRISRSTGDGLIILLRDGNPGQTCRLLTSTTLSNWVCVATNQVGANGTFLFEENCDAGESLRLYKVALP